MLKCHIYGKSSKYPCWGHTIHGSEEGGGRKGKGQVKMSCARSASKSAFSKYIINIKYRNSHQRGRLQGG